MSSYDDEDSFQRDLAELMEEEKQIRRRDGIVDPAEEFYQKAEEVVDPEGAPEIPATKEQCVEVIERLRKTLHYPKIAHSNLMKRKLNDLQEQAGALIREVSEKIECKTLQDEDGQPQQVYKIDNGLLFLEIHMIASQVVEAMGYKLEKTKLNTNLEGLTERFKQEREELLDVLTQLSKEDNAFTQLIRQYSSPLVRYALLTSRVIYATGCDNHGISEKKQDGLADQGLGVDGQNVGDY